MDVSRPSPFARAATLTLLTALPLAAQGASPPPAALLADLDPRILARSSAPHDFVRLADNLVVFFATVDDFDDVVCITDGTPGGTSVVADPPAPIRNVVRVGARVVFGAGDEMWSTDGSIAGTLRLAPARVQTVPATGTDAPYVVVAASTNTSGNDSEPWVTGGTPGTTQRLADLEPGVGSSGPDDFHAVPWTDVRGTTTRQLTFFSASTTTHGRELWVTEGTSSSTVRVTDLVPGSGSGVARGMTLAAHVLTGGDRLFVAYRGTSAATGREVFRLLRDWMDPTFTDLGAVDIRAGSVGSSPDELLTFGDDAVCVATGDGTGRELWAIDHRSGQSTLIDIRPGSSGSAPLHLLVGPATRSPGGAVYVSAFRDDVGRELFRYTGGASADLVDDLVPGTDSSEPVPELATGARVWFAATTPATGREPWSTDGSAAGTSLIADLQSGPPSSEPTFGAAVRSGGPTTVTLTALGPAPVGREPYATTAGGPPTLLADLLPSAPADSDPRPYLRLSHGRLAFTATSDLTGRELWLAAPDGSAPTLLESIPGSDGPVLGASLALDDGSFLFVQGTGLLPIPTLWGLYRSTGSPGGTTLASILGNTAPSIREIVELGDRVYFFVNATFFGRSLWRANRDGTGAAPIFSPIDGARDLTAAGDRLFFVADEPNTGSELWAWQPGVGSPYRVLDIAPGPASSSPEHLIAFRNRCYFVADDGVHGRELWRSNGVGSNTEIVLDANPSGDGVLSELVSSSGQALFYRGTDGTNGEELWRSTGFTTGTGLIADLAPGAASSSPRDITWVHPDRVACTADDGTLGRELWLVDTLGNATPFDLRPGPIGSNPSELHWTTRYLLFSASDGTHGREPWFADGIDFTTVAMVADVRPGSASSNPTGFTAHGPRALFAADVGGALGNEPWTVDLGANATTIGTSCGEPDSILSFGGTAPRLGSAIGVWGFGVRPGRSALILLSAVPGLPFVNPLFNCPLQLDLSTIVTADQFVTTGNFIRAIPVPTTPTLAGAVVRAQCLQLIAPGQPFLTSNGLELWLGT